MSKKAQWQATVWEDIEYTIRIKAEDYSAHWELFSMVCLPPGEIKYAKKGWRSLPMDVTANLDEAQPCAKGWIKWDGCHEFTVGDGENSYHVCGKRNMSELTTALLRVYDVAAEAIPHWKAMHAMFSEQCSQLAVTLHRERLRRQKAEAHVAYMQERIQRVLGLPIWPADEENTA